MTRMKRCSVFVTQLRRAYLDSATRLLKPADNAQILLEPNRLWKRTCSNSGCIFDFSIRLMGSFETLRPAIVADASISDYTGTGRNRKGRGGQQGSP